MTKKLIIVATIVLFNTLFSSCNEIRPSKIFHEPNSKNEVNNSLIDKLPAKECSVAHNEILQYIKNVDTGKQSPNKLNSVDGLGIYCRKNEETNIKEGFTPVGLLAEATCYSDQITDDEVNSAINRLHSLGYSLTNTKVSAYFKGYEKYHGFLDIYINCANRNKNENNTSPSIVRNILNLGGPEALSNNAFLALKNEQIIEQIIPLMGNLNRRTNGYYINTLLGVLVGDVVGIEESGKKIDIKKVELLLKNGADPNLAYGTSGILPLQYLLKNIEIDIEYKLSVASLLFEYGADPNVEYDLGFVNMSLREPLPFYALAHTYVYGNFNGINGGNHYPGKEYKATTHTSDSVSTEDHMSVLKYAVDELGMEYDRETLVGTMVNYWKALSLDPKENEQEFRKELRDPKRVEKRINELLSVF